MDAVTTARITRRRAAASLDRRERRYLGTGPRAGYSARAYNRATRQAVKAELRAAAR